MNSYSQVGQDKWVLSLFPEGHTGVFLDIGCNDPQFSNNTLLLEEHGWTGIAVDIVDYSDKWKERNAVFINANALTYDFDSIIFWDVIDYLSLDIDDFFMNYEMLRIFLEKPLQFKAITIEHNLYIGKGFENEQRFQRKLLEQKGYTLVYGNVKHGGNAFEDWWINPKFF